MRSVESSYVKSLGAEQETAADLIFALKLQGKKEEGIIFPGFLLFFLLAVFIVEVGVNREIYNSVKLVLS